VMIVCPPERLAMGSCDSQLCCSVKVDSAAVVGEAAVVADTWAAVTEVCSRLCGGTYFALTWGAEGGPEDDSLSEPFIAGTDSVAGNVCREGEGGG
jgi:hypothetical protein